jgi:hypothetical protein
MIQAIRETNFDAYIETKANRIGNQKTDKTRHLVKFINDLDGAVFYAYPTLENMHARYTQMAFTYAVAINRYTGKINLKPAGYYKYEVYEVSWIEPPALASDTAPATEIDVLPVADDNGVVEGLVAIGKLYLSEKEGDEEVQYIQNAKRVQTLTIVNGGSGYVTTVPDVIIEAPGTTGGHQATATCTISGGAVNTVTITYAGSGYITNPTVTITGGGGIDANITASIEQTNYIYYGQ